MNKKLIFFAIIALAVGIGALTMVFYFNNINSNKEQINNNLPSNNPEILPEAEPVQERFDPTTIPEATLDNNPSNVISSDQIELERMSLSFAEKYGTFSNQSNLSNLEDSMLYMSENFRETTKKYIENERQKNKSLPDEYFGITTRALSATTDNLNAAAGTAKITVATQRQESSNNKSLTYYQKLQIKLIRENDVWLVDSATWGNKESN